MTSYKTSRFSWSRQNFYFLRTIKFAYNVNLCITAPLICPPDKFCLFLTALSVSAFNSATINHHLCNVVTSPACVFSLFYFTTSFAAGSQLIWVKKNSSTIDLCCSLNKTTCIIYTFVNFKVY